MTRTDLNEIQGFYDANLNARDYCEAMKGAARRRNTLAHYNLGQWYLTGVWDVKAMEDDLLLGKLKAETADPRQDPYFILEKDPKLGVKLLRSFLQQCELKKIYQLNLYKPAAETLLDRHDPHFNPEAEAQHAKPMSRPVLTRNSFEMLFHDTAWQYLTIFFKMIVLASLYAVAFSGLGYVVITDTMVAPFWRLVAAIAIFIFVPAAFMVAFILFFGVYRSMPLCSCRSTGKNLQRIINRLPEPEQLTVSDPFQTTPFPIRNSLRAFTCYFGLVLLSILAAFYYSRNKYLHPRDVVLRVPLLGYCDFYAFNFTVFVIAICALLLFGPPNFSQDWSHHGCHNQFNREKNPIVLQGD